ncbi:sorting nexin-13-like isoform X2 [Varroa destructor]|uniref:Sorting nexin-13 n=1 Tax=Varroa destructor TaxID=109461 RepID=A0A7M7KG13_VARDE|nr:sorting nexin-13-like isoform X2 [Varroa destructor]
MMSVETAVVSWLAGSVAVLWLCHGSYFLTLLLPLAALSLIAGLTSFSYMIEIVEGKTESDPLTAALRSGAETEVTISDSNIPFQGIPHITRSVLSPSRKPRRERYLTGHSVIDESLSDVLQLLFRDYVLPWYSRLSTDESFLAHIKDLFHEVVVNLSNKAKEVDWVNYLTVNLVDDFASHLRLFRQAQAKVQRRPHQESSYSNGRANADHLLHTFFRMETAMEQYLQQVSEVLLYLLLPPADFQNHVTRAFLRELIANIVLLPVIDMITDPDYINQTIVWMVRQRNKGIYKGDEKDNKEAVVPSEDFLAVLRCTDSLDELVATQQIVRHEIAVQRSRDTGGEQDEQVKQQLKSLFYVDEIITKRIQRLEDGTFDADSSGLPCPADLKKLMANELCNLSFDDILCNNIALSYFIEFMTSVGAQNLIMFHLHVEGFKTSAEQVAPGGRDIPSGTRLEGSVQSLREAAQHIYNTYLSEQASPRIPVDQKHIRKFVKRFSAEKFNMNWFDDVQAEVVEQMQEAKFFGAFKKSSYYIRLLIELELITEPREPSLKSDEDLDSVGLSLGICSYGSGDDSASLNSLEPGSDEVEFLTPPPDELLAGSATAPTLPLTGDSAAAESYLCAAIYNTGIVRRGASTYALYAISVTKLEPNQMEAKWCVFRRYSDFYEFHSKLQRQFPHVLTTPFPGKKTFNNMSTAFLEQRKTQLNMYLQSVLQPTILNNKDNLEMAKLVEQFLEPGRYEHTVKKSKRGMGVIVNPLRSSVKSVGSMVKNVPENIFDGLKDGLGRVMRSRAAEQLEDSSKVGAGIDVDADDNIPFRILLLLMDEVFDLKARNTWLRRRIIVILRQIVKTTFGDTINRKIVESVEERTSSDQIAEYVKTLKNALWPNGIPAEQGRERDPETKSRTRVAAKMLLLCSVTDDLRRIIGSDTTRRGMLCVFEMFQQQALNRRLVYVLMEGMLASLFPNNKFCELFRKWHATSPTISMVSVYSGSTGGGARSPLATPETAHRQMAAPSSTSVLTTEAIGSGTR